MDVVIEMLADVNLEKDLQLCKLHGRIVVSKDVYWILIYWLDIHYCVLVEILLLVKMWMAVFVE